MPDIEIKVDQKSVEEAARLAVEAAVSKHINGSPVIQKAVETAIANSMTDITPMLKAALERAVSDVMLSSDVFHKMLEKALLDNTSKLTGAFEASMRKMGRDLALDRTTLEKVIDNVKNAIDTEAAVNFEKMQALGAGNFA